MRYLKVFKKRKQRKSDLTNSHLIYTAYQKNNSSLHYLKRDIPQKISN